MSYSEEELSKAVDAVFACYDTDHNGALYTQEVINLINDALKQMKQSRKVSQAYLDQFMNSVDSNHDNKITKKELLEIFRKVTA